MARQLPSTGIRGCDTSDLIMIHGMFRKVFTDAPALVRSVPAGDTVHAAAVSQHVADIAADLHNHHHSEDLILWDELTARAPACALHVGQMREQHAAVGVALKRLEELIPYWRTGAQPSAREDVATALEDVGSILFPHLGQEESDISPVASAVLTQQEWDSLGEHGRAGVPRERKLVQLGYIFASMTPAAGRAWAKKDLPWIARLMYTLVGRRQWLAEQRSMRVGG